MDRIEAMQAFVAVADLKGFAPAARKLRPLTAPGRWNRRCDSRRMSC